MSTEISLNIETIQSIPASFLKLKTLDISTSLSNFHIIANSLGLYQTAPYGAGWLGSTLFFSEILAPNFRVFTVRQSDIDVTLPKHHL